MKLVELSLEQSLAYEDSEVTAIHIAIGVLVQVHEPSLRSGFQIAGEGTAVAGAELVVRPVPLAIACLACECDFEASGIQDLRCPHCHGFSTEVRHGNELDLEFIELCPGPEAAPNRAVPSEPRA